jgi:hypothetical protein
MRCKDVWVVGANRYRNPEDYLPADFEVRRAAYYQALNLPLQPERHIADLQAEMREALRMLDTGLPVNQLVSIGRKRNFDGWITVTPFDPQPDPVNLAELKADVTATWPMTSLLDMFKETEHRLNITRVLKSVTAHETMGREGLNVIEQ